MHIAIGSDHAGFTLKQVLKEHLASLGHQVDDFGCPDETSVDYPDIARPLAEAVVGGHHDLGILVCSNGVGMSIAANKVRGVRAALCHDPFSARRAREHTDANVLCLGAWCIGQGLALEVLEAFLQSRFQGGRHARRVDKVRALDESREVVP